MTARTVDFFRMTWIALGLTAAAAGACVLTGLGSWGGLLLGSAFMLANVHLIRSLVSRLSRPDANQSFGIFLLIAKLSLMLLLLAGGMLQFPLEPMSFAFGATVVPVALIVEALWTGDEAPPLSPEASGEGDPDGPSDGWDS